MPNGQTRHNNLPPPEVASAIPCRYFPACRYGSGCLFQHPQTPYFQGAIPQPYPNSYEQIPQQPYAPTYYPVSPPSFPPPVNGQPPQQGPPMSMHGPPASDMGHFSPNYGPISPIMYSHPGHMSIPPLPPLHPGAPTPQSPPAAFNPSSPLQPNGHVAPYSSVNGAVYSDMSKSSQLNAQLDAAGPRQDMANRRGTARRGSFARSKPIPPCMFFPLGRCKNGDDCRFPHIMPQDGVPVPMPFYPSRGGGPRSRGQSNGYAAIDEKMANLSLGQNGHSGATLRGRGGKPAVNGVNKRTAFPVKQRVPNADEFPVLGGATTPPIRVNGGFVNGHGPTAAQILQGPRPVWGNSSQAATPRNASPEHNQEANSVAEVLPLSFASVATAGTDVAVAA
ncbi:hypothetical protein C8F01DRAFT_1244506 [Mycena amicta]|nr:hypothetical protein C8F01DRAFT_1244506 [Mycena amicta]